MKEQTTASGSRRGKTAGTGQRVRKAAPAKRASSPKAGKTASAKTGKTASAKTGKTTSARAAKAAPAVRARKKTPAAPSRRTAVRTAARTVKKEPLKIIPIGGLREIGKNLTVLEYGNQILLVDCGMSFPEEDMLGIDVVIPDFSYLIENAKKIVGLIITHGHEDHIGGIPYLLKKINIPVYGTPITIGLIDNKLKEHGITGDLRRVKAGERIKIGRFDIDVIRTTHSVADAVCFYIKTPGATLFHTGDFKVDYTPIDGEPIDLRKFAEVGASGVDVMLADSTNAIRPGYTRSERYVGEALERIFSNTDGRIIIATFSSNVHRVQTIIDLTKKYGRKFSVSGRSMEKVVTLAQELGYLKVPRGLYVPLEKSDALDDDKMVIITTGSQGEPMSALARMAGNEHRNVTLKKGDTVILSSTPVPGNEKSVSNVVNKLYDKGIKVIYNEIMDIHVSGHACQEELKLIHSLIRPRFFMPVHGESRHLAEHGKLAESIGMPKKNIFIMKNGDCLTVSAEGASVQKSVAAAEDVMVDGFGVGDIGTVVLKDRKLLSEAGLIMVVCTMDSETGEMVSGPEIVSRGFVYVKESEEILEGARQVAEKAVKTRTGAGILDRSEIKDGIRSDLRKYILGVTHRTPIIVPIIMEV